MHIIFNEIDSFQKEKKEKFTLIDNPLQELCVYGGCTIFLISVVLYITGKIEIFSDTTNSLLNLISLCLFVGTEFLMILYQWSTLLPDILKTLKSPMHTFLVDSSRNIEHMNELATRLSIYNKEDLELAENLIKIESQHLKKRIGLLVGALETVGIIPLVVTTGISAYGILIDKKIPYIEVIAYTLFGFYIFMLYCNLFSHRLDKLALIVNHSLKFKLTKN